MELYNRAAAGSIAPQTCIPEILNLLNFPLDIQQEIRSMGTTGTVRG